MSDRFQLLARRFADARPGLDLVAIEDAAIPVTVLRADVLAQERHPLPIAEEFVLRMVARGVERPGRISSFLGLDDIPVLEAVAAQIGAGNIRRKQSGALGLTALGSITATDLADIRPVDRQVPVSFDRVTWKIAAYQEARLMEKGEATDAGFRILPASKNAHITADDIPVRDFDALVRSEVFQVLRVRRVSTKKYRYLPVQMLVFADAASGELDLALCVDDRMSTSHGFALAKLEAVARLGLKYEAVKARPILEPELEQRRVHDKVLHQSLEPQANGESSAADLVRGVGVFEHPGLLDDALETASRRILLISPWIRRAVVTPSFVAKLEKRIRAGVNVTIAHGFGEDDRGSDEDAIARLQGLAARHKKFTFVRLRNTHAKVLIFDDKWISTSFNWLSFRGDPDRTYRMEEGTLVAIPSRVAQEYQRYEALIVEQRI